jgi:maleylpyruvate isomerase
MKLYGYFRSSATYRVRIALNFKGIAFEQELIDLRPPKQAQHSPEFRALNPQGLIPVLVDGDRVLTQSLAILEYLEETQPQPALLPPGAEARAAVRALALHIACDIHPLNNSRVLAYLRDPLRHDERTVDSWVAHWITLGFSALEEQVGRQSGDGRHMFGHGVTFADICLVPQMFNARRFHVDLTPFPRLLAINAYLETLPAFARAAPHLQPDAQ